jgi:Fe-S cluster biogenesis protein NfuA
VVSSDVAKVTTSGACDACASAQAIARTTVVWMSSVLRVQVVTIDHVSALKKPTLDDK